MRSITRSLFLAAASAAALVVAAPTQGRACDFLHHLFCWCRRPAPVVVEPVVTPGYSYYLGDDYRTEVYYASSGWRTEAYYPSYGCATSIELGTAPPPAPPAEDGYLEPAPERTFEEESQQSSEKPVEPGGAPAEPSGEGAAPSGADAASQPAGGSQSFWLPISRSTARALLSQKTRRGGTPRRVAPYVRASHPGWVPVENAPAKRLAAK